MDTPSWSDVELNELTDQLLAQQGDPHTLSPAPYPHAVIAERGRQDDALEGLGGRAGGPGGDLRKRRAHAIAAGLTMARAGTFVGIGFCLRETRELLGAPALWPDASTAWDQADDKHPGEPAPMFGVPLWWVNDGPGHVALDLRRDGLCLTTDYVETGRWGVAPIDALASWCGGRFRGWTGDINGVTVWRKPEPWGHDERVELVREALQRAKENGAPQRRIDGLRRWLDQLRDKS